MTRRVRPQRLWPLGITMLALGLLVALPLLAQGPSRLFLPMAATAADPEPEVAPQVLRIARVVLRGAGPGFNSDEYLQIKNVSAAPAELAGVRLVGGLGLSPTRPYVFPAATLPAGASALVFSKGGSDNPDGGLFYLNGSSDVWRYSGAAELRDPQGRLLSRVALPGGPLPAPTAAPTAAPLITPTPFIPPGGSVEINDIVLKDPAFPNESEEYVQIRNASDADINIGGWRLANASRPGQTPPFVFPSFNLEVDVTIAVFSAVGDNDLDIGDFYWDQTSDVWKVGDRAELRDAQGNLMATLIVPQQ